MKAIITKPTLENNQVKLHSSLQEIPTHLLVEKPFYADRLKAAAKKGESVYLLTDTVTGQTEILQSSAVVVESVKKIADNLVTISFWDHPALLKLNTSTDDAQASLNVLMQSLQKYKQVLITEKNGFILNARAYDGKSDSAFLAATAFASVPSALRTVISEAELAQLFTFLANEACSLHPNNIDYCITFQYAWNGCFARAHKMRQIMANQFNLACQKIFNYGSLAVDAYNQCVTWGWHVAPVVTVVSATGTNTQYVLDPSIAGTPLNIDQWRNLQLNGCSPGAYLASCDVVDGRCYGRKNFQGNYADFDDDYSRTDQFLIEYQNTPTLE